MITCQVEPFVPFLEEVKPLLQKHYEEIALNQDKVPLDPQYDIYLARAARDEILLVTVREAGALVGYFVGFVTPALHYRTCLTLQMDIFWLEPLVRAHDSLDRIEADMVAADLFTTVKKEAIRRGVKRPFFGSKSFKDAHVLFESMGMHETERYFSAWWGE